MCLKKIGKQVKLYARETQWLKEYKVKWFSEEELNEDDICLVSVDSAHYCTFKVQSDPGKEEYSHKSQGADFAYKLAIAIQLD